MKKKKKQYFFQINKTIFEYIGVHYINEMNLFNKEILKEYRNYANCFRHDQKDSSNNINWREKNWNNLTDKIKNEKLKELLIVSLEIYVWLDFKKIIM